MPRPTLNKLLCYGGTNRAGQDQNREVSIWQQIWVWLSTSDAACCAHPQLFRTCLRLAFVQCLGAMQSPSRAVTWPIRAAHYSSPASLVGDAAPAPRRGTALPTGPWRAARRRRTHATWRDGVVRCLMAMGLDEHLMLADAILNGH
jgi:hypothetical protein